MSGQGWIVIGALLAGLAVAAGAFGAHGLDQYFPKKYEGQTRKVAGVEIPAAQKYLADFKTGAEYQMYHALALVAIGLLFRTQRSGTLQVAGWCFLAGIVLFSGGLYALTLTGERRFGAIVPIGGVLFLVGWIVFAVGAATSRSTKPANGEGNHGLTGVNRLLAAREMPR